METGTHELTAAYALDALDPEERRRYEEHLAGCASCRDELASFWEVTGALALAATGPEPRPVLREHILAAARAERQNVVPLEPRRHRFVVPGVTAVAAVAAAVAIGLGFYASSISNDLDEARSALAALFDPEARTVALEGAQGRLVIGPNGDAALVVSGLPERAGKTYVVWVVEAGMPRRAGLFDSAAEATIVELEERVPSGSAVAVSIENGPVDAPTTDPIVTSAPA